MPHTPGPWIVDGVEVLCSAGPLRKHVVWELGNHNPDDANLIAAAPDLLAACQAALNDRMYKDWPAIADLLIAAIAKAEGTLKA